MSWPNIRSRTFTEVPRSDCTWNNTMAISTVSQSRKANSLWWCTVCLV